MIPDLFHQRYVHRYEKLIYDYYEEGLGVYGHFMLKFIVIKVITLMIKNILFVQYFIKKQILIVIYAIALVNTVSMKY